jgi:hypothetical protein
VALPPLLQWLTQERNWVRTRGSVSRRVVDCVRCPFSQEQYFCPSLLTTLRMVAIPGPREIRMVEGHMRIERGKHVTCWSSFPYRVYINSNRRDSRLRVSLVCGSLHVVN